MARSNLVTIHISCFTFLITLSSADGLYVQKLASRVPLVTQTSKVRSLDVEPAPSTRLWKSWDVNVLSRDPLVYIVPNFLSPQECQSYIDRVDFLGSHQNRTMARSNPPEVSIDVTKLWPLPFLSLSAAIPTLLHHDFLNTGFYELVQVLWKPVLLALAISITVAFSAVSAIQYFSSSFSRTSNAMAFNQVEDVEFVRPLVDRVVMVTDHCWSRWEAPVVTHYPPGARFAKHGDASPTKGSEWLDVGGQRIVTCICYLNTVEGGGGETAFDQLGIQVQPKQCSALFFYPSDANTLEADERPRASPTRTPRLLWRGPLYNLADWMR